MTLKNEVHLNHPFLTLSTSKVMPYVVYMQALTRMAMVSALLTVTMMAAPRASLATLLHMTAVLKMVEAGGSVAVAQQTCMEIGTLGQIIDFGHLASTGSPGEALCPTQLRQHA